VNPIFFLGEIPKHPTRDPFGSTWPDHFSKADDGPDNVEEASRPKCTARWPFRQAALADSYTHWLQIITKRKNFRWRNVFDDNV